MAHRAYLRRALAGQLSGAERTNAEGAAARMTQLRSLTDAEAGAFLTELAAKFKAIREKNEAKGYVNPN
jgi:hypothetical protein